jgi:2-dehydro-3-deoxyphosphogluconate aldolase/(4S)-4-hydroxy-2-oxoglutarate aldolase
MTASSESAFAALGIVPVLTIDDFSLAVPVGEALMAGGLPCVEVAFRTAGAAKAIAAIRAQLGDMLIGAGTVLTRDQADLAVQSGAQFIVSPGIHRAVTEWCLEHKIPVFPGIATATEIAVALDYGLTVLKFFPAEQLGGVAMLRALSAPYRSVRFLPTGGVSSENLSRYLSEPSVVACGGSWMVKRELISAGNFKEITARAQQARDIVEEVRKVVAA